MDNQRYTPRQRLWGCRAPLAFVVVGCLSVGLCCMLGLVAGVVIGELTGGLGLLGEAPGQHRIALTHVSPSLSTDGPATHAPTWTVTRTPRPMTPAREPPALTRAPLQDDRDVAEARADAMLNVPPPSEPPDYPALPTIGLPANQPARPATRLVIPALGVDAPVVLIGLQSGTWSVDQLTVETGHLQGTASPGDPSNVAIAGHVALAKGGDGPFRNLSELKRGDEVQVFEGERQYEYVVTEVRTVSPAAVEVTYPTAEPVLTLITCASWNPGRRVYDDRIVARARLAP